MTNSIITLNNLSSGYKGMEILHGINLWVKSDEIVAIIGPNGAGKSTVLKSIFNQCQTFQGKVTFKGENITNLSTHNLIYKGISYIPQGRQVFSDLTVEENLEMGVFIMKNRKLMKQNLEEIYRKFPLLKDRKKQLAGNLSGGEQQILALGRALIQNPDLILLDEPSLGLSPKAMQQIFDNIKKLNKEGIAIIIVEQNAKQAVSIADRTYILESGNIALEGDKNILKNKEIRNIYFGGY